MGCMLRQEEIGGRRILTGPDVPSVRISLWFVPQPVKGLMSKSVNGRAQNLINWAGNELLSILFADVGLSLFNRVLVHRSNPTLTPTQGVNSWETAYPSIWIQVSEYANQALGPRRIHVALSNVPCGSSPLNPCGASPGYRVIRPLSTLQSLRPEDLTYFRLSLPPRPVFLV